MFPFFFDRECSGKPQTKALHSFDLSKVGIPDTGPLVTNVGGLWVRVPVRAGVLAGGRGRGTLERGVPLSVEPGGEPRVARVADGLGRARGVGRGRGLAGRARRALRDHWSLELGHSERERGQARAPSAVRSLPGGPRGFSSA